jgi:hypothetical protein
MGVGSGHSGSRGTWVLVGGVARGGVSGVSGLPGPQFTFIFAPLPGLTALFTLRSGPAGTGTGAPGFTTNRLSAR